MFRRFAVAVFGVVLALGSASAASAHVKVRVVAPLVNFWPSPVPLIGQSLSMATTGAPYWLARLKDGWTMTSANGIASAYVQYSDTTIWGYPPAGQPGGAHKVTGKYQWTQRVGHGDDLFGSATDQQGNTGTNAAFIFPGLSNSSSASYSGGWQTSACKCYINGQILYSTKPGAMATFQVSESTLVSFVSDTGPGRGVVALAVNGHPSRM